MCRSILFEKKNKNEKRERERSSLSVDHKADEEIEQESNLEEERSHAEKEHTKQELINMKSDLETSRQRTAQSLHDKINKEKERAQMLNERLEKEKLKKLSETFEREKEKKEELKKQLHAAKYETLVSKELRKTELQDMEAKLLGLRLKQFKISKLFMDLKNAEKVDICFLIDSTGSMSGVINEVKTVINRIIERLTKRFKDLALRCAFVGYRDIDDGGDRVCVFKFSENPDEFRAFVSGVRATGGADECEDVRGSQRSIRSRNGPIRPPTSI